MAYEYTNYLLDHLRLPCCGMEDDAPLLSRPGTLGDIIAWVLTVPLILEAPLWLRLPWMVPNFKHMFNNLHATLPLPTQIVLTVPPVAWMIMCFLVTLALVILLLQLRSDLAKVAFAFLGSCVVHGIIVLIIGGIAFPILELQKQLS